MKIKLSNIITVSVLALTLTGAVLYANVFAKSREHVETGYQIGQLCYSQEIEVIRGETTSWKVEDSRGKVAVINFWFTTCPGCLAELPGFDEVYKETSSFVDMIAIHQNTLPPSKVNAFIDNTFPEYTMLFGLDDEDSEYYAALGGKGAWPMTLVLDKEGVIRYKYETEVEKETLLAAVNELNKD